MGLGRISRFVKVPAGARRLPVMRLGTHGQKALAPSMELLRDFAAAKKALRKEGMAPAAAHAETFRRVDYARRFRGQILGDPRAVEALRSVIGESKRGDLYLMCMCPPRTPDRACHTYLLLDLARELDPSVELLPEPVPGLL